jgi:hypothetical protein
MMMDSADECRIQDGFTLYSSSKRTTCQTFHHHSMIVPTTAYFRRGLRTSSPPQLGHILFMAVEHGWQKVHS